MTFDETLTHVIDLLRRDERVSYRALKLRFGIDDEYIEGLKDELIAAKKLAVDEDDKVLVWVGTAPVPSSEFRVSNSTQSPTPNPQPPSSYTPAHLAERIRAVVLTEGERKTITALFADLKGSTALIEGLDPEEARAIIDPALQLMMDAVHRYEGYVAQVLGDGIFALFGAPIAHEDHPQRALYAALRMQEEMRRYGDQVRLKHGVPLLLRVGVNTGAVVVRSIRKDDLHTDYVPVGHSTNLAARMEQMATPGSILVSEYTHHLAEGYFEFKALGKAQIKGVEKPLSVYEVLGAGPLRTRLQVSARRGLTRFVGRHSEMEQMQRVLERTKAGHGQIVGVMGEPGLGKSRLFYEFKLLSLSGCLILEAYSVSHGKATAYLPVIELLRSYFRIESQDDERTRRQKVIGQVLELDRSLEDTLPYLFALLGVEEQPSPLQQMDAQIRRRRTFEALKKLFLRESLNQPLILIFEDLHWIDGETQGFLEVLSESVASAKILLLTNYRPEYRHEWGQKTYYTQLRLAPFGKAEAEEFLDVLLSIPVGAVREPPLHQLKALILEKTEGTPFFMEEIVQELFEQGILVRGAAGVETRRSASLPTDLHIPTTVQGVLAARLDRLVPDEKTLLQQLAVIGREFPLSLIRQVIPQPEDELYRLLSSLQRKEFLYEQPAFPEVEYFFKHALTQEVAYNSVLIERRKVLHEQTAQVIEQLFRDRVEEHYDELAYHYQRSGNIGKAIEYLHKAGQQAAQKSAHMEAITCLTSALELLKAFPDTSERAQQELSLQLALSASLATVRGPGSQEAGDIYIRAQALCNQLGETPQLLPVLRGLCSFHMARAEVRAAREIGEQLFTLAQKLQDMPFLIEAHRTLAEALFFLGELIHARSYFEKGASLSELQQRQLGSLFHRGDPGVACRARVARVLWALGYPDQALVRSQEALALAQDLSDPKIIAYALYDAGAVHHFRREGPKLQERGEALVALAREQDFSFDLASGHVLCGLATIEYGQEAEGVEQMRQGLSALQVTGAILPWTVWSAPLAEACWKIGLTEEGMSVINETLALAEKTGGRAYEAELYRVKGELTLQKFQASLRQASSKFQASQDQSEDTDPRPPNPAPQGEAEACFLKAIEIARAQQAKSLELRAVMSLVRLRQRQASEEGSRNTHYASRIRLAEAHTMLSEIYNWFTEGFDTKDLQEAKGLLEELSL